MCGRITQKSPPDQLRLTILMGTPDDSRVTKAKPRYNGAPSQDLLVIRRHPKTGEYLQDLLRWGLIPNWTKEISPKLKPINATAERVATAPMFRDAYARRRCIVPVDNFFEWKAVPSPERSSALSASSQPQPMNWCWTSMTACRSSSHRRLPLAGEHRARSQRPADALPGRAHDDVADLDQGEQARPRSRRFSTRWSLSMAGLRRCYDWRIR